MAETLQRTEQVITMAELREILDDADEKSFADLTSKGVAGFEAALGVASRTAAGASGRIQNGRMMIDSKPMMSALGQQQTSLSCSCTTPTGLMPSRAREH